MPSKNTRLNFRPGEQLLAKLQAAADALRIPLCEVIVRQLKWANGLDDATLQEQDENENTTSEMELMRADAKEYRMAHDLENDDDESEPALVSTKSLRDMSPDVIDEKVWKALDDIVDKEGYGTIRHLLGRIESWWNGVKDLPENRAASKMTNRELLDFYVRRMRPAMFSGKLSRFRVERIEPPRQQRPVLHSSSPPRLNEQVDSYAGIRGFRHNAADQYNSRGSSGMHQLPLQIVW
jgi:hypothetical protein